MVHEPDSPTQRAQPADAARVTRVTRVARVPAVPVLVAALDGAAILTSDGEIDHVAAAAAAGRLQAEPHLIVHTAFTARRFGVRVADLAPQLDVLELFAFVHPARFCTPTPAGLAQALGLALAVPGASGDDSLIAVSEAARVLVRTLADGAYPDRDQAAALAQTMRAAGWTWGETATLALGPPALSQTPDVQSPDTRPPRGKTRWHTGLEVWQDLPEWREAAPRGAAGTRPVAPEEAIGRLRQLVGADAEDRQVQRDYAAAASCAFLPRVPGEPHVVLAEAGTGTGKTLGYIAPASLWAQRNDAAVWLSTYTKNLQRQLDQELTGLYPDSTEKSEKAVMRKGRENYLCLLNFEDAAGRAAAGATLLRDGATGTVGVPGAAALIQLGLIARWVRASRDGDMLGGDFPAWLVAGAARVGHQGGGSGLTDRRGECVYSACPHYRICFIERAVRKARSAQIVVANHALVLTQAANAYIPDTDGEAPAFDAAQRIVFDEGHHVFDAADSAFATAVSGVETAELRRWIRGPEARRARRTRGLRERVGDLIADSDGGPALLDEAMRAAAALAGPGWPQRLQRGEAVGPAEGFLALVRAQVLARTDEDATGFSLETPVSPPLAEVPDAALKLAQALDALARPLHAIAGLLSARLKDDSDALDTAARLRIEAAQRGLLRRAGGLIPAWISMLRAIGGEPDAAHVEWFEISRIDGRERDVAMRRHWLDPTQPLAEVVLDRAQGVLITSATLRDAPAPAGGHETDPPQGLEWHSADIRTGAQHLAAPALRRSFTSPFAYAQQARVFAVHDLGRARPEVLAGAYKTLFTASGGGALGIFTAIARLRAVHAHLRPLLAQRGLNLYAQHVDAMDVGTLVDIFRSEPDSCLLGTDAVRDGVDVPGEALRMLVFDRVPWPRPDILHKARRAAFGGGRYDDMIARLRLRQAFGRLIRTSSDKGVFVILAPLPSKLLSALPDGVTVERMGLADVARASAAFLGRGSSH